MKDKKIKDLTDIELYNLLNEIKKQKDKALLRKDESKYLKLDAYHTNLFLEQSKRADKKAKEGNIDDLLSLFE